MTEQGGPDQDPRVFLAAERTLLAWIRTNLALIGLGFVVARFHVLSPARISHLIGICFVVAGMTFTVLATRGYLTTIRRLIEGESFVARPAWLAIALATFLVALGSVMVLYLLRDA